MLPWDATPNKFDEHKLPLFLIVEDCFQIIGIGTKLVLVLQGLMVGVRMPRCSEIIDNRLFCSKIFIS